MNTVTTTGMRIAVVQAAYELMDGAATLDKTVQLIGEAAQGGAELIAFPEVFILGTPVPPLRAGRGSVDRADPGRRGRLDRDDAAHRAGGPLLRRRGQSVPARRSDSRELP